MATVGVKGLNLKEFVHRSSELYFCVAFYTVRQMLFVAEGSMTAVISVTLTFNGLYRYIVWNWNVLCAFRREMKEGAEILTAKIQRYRPKIAVFNGKGLLWWKWWCVACTSWQHWYWYKIVPLLIQTTSDDSVWLCDGWHTAFDVKKDSRHIGGRCRRSLSL